MEEMGLCGWGPGLVYRRGEKGRASLDFGAAPGPVAALARRTGRAGAGRRRRADQEQTVRLERAGGPEPLNWYLELRMIPRSNLLQEKSPLPLSQGTDEWSWTGHYVWTDAEAPAGLLFGNRVTKRGDFQWTLNQAHYVLESGKAPGI